MSNLKITQIRSTIRRSEKQKRTIKALGLGKLHKTVIQKDVPQVRGMIKQVSHLVAVEEVKK